MRGDIILLFIADISVLLHMTTNEKNVTRNQITSVTNKREPFHIYVTAEE